MTEVEHTTLFDVNSIRYRSELLGRQNRSARDGNVFRANYAWLGR